MNFTERLLEKTNARSFYGRYTKLRKRPGKDECKGLCPLHEEKTPSFSVNLETGSFYCFGCTEGGGPVQFESKRLGISTKEACKRLAQEFGISRKDAKPQSQKRKGGKESGPTPSASDSDPQLRTANGELGTEILSALVDAGRPLDDKAIAFFARRKIHPETLDRFQIAFLADPRHTEETLLRQFEPDALLASGAFFKARSGNLRLAFLNHPLLFPILRAGRPIWLQGRRLYPDQSQRKYSNLAGVEVPGLFNADRLLDLAPQSPLCLCEGAPDTMILEQEEVAAVGIVGVGAFKPEWIPQLEPFQIHLALDNDTAGQSGADRIRDLFHGREQPVRLVTLPEDFNDINDLVAARGIEAFRERLGKAKLLSPDLISIVKALRRRALDRSDDFDLTDLGERIYRWFESNGGQFFWDLEMRAFLLFDKVLYRIGDNPEFNKLMLAKARLLPVQTHTRAVYSGLQTFCTIHGKQQTTSHWTMAAEDDGELYINLHNASHQVVRLRPGQVDVFANGDNPAGVLLGRSSKMGAIEYDPQADPAESVRLLKTLVADALACQPEHRLFLVSWLLTAFFLEYTDEKALYRLAGNTKSGKSTAAKILSMMLYGSELHVEAATVAYSYSDASRNPLLLCDNLENENLGRDMIQFLLHVATGVSRGKRQGGTDSDTVDEPVQALVAVTAIEPLPREELLNRTYEVHFEKRYKQAGFIRRNHLKRIGRHRDAILSGIFKLFADEVLPGMASERETLVHRIEANFPDQSKDRSNAFLSLMLLILQALLKMLDPQSDPQRKAWGMLTRWIEYQEDLANEWDRESNPTAYWLDALAKELQAVGSEQFDRVYYVKGVMVKNEAGELTEVRLEAQAKYLLMGFEKLAKERGHKLPFRNPTQLGSRVSNDAALLAKSGWAWEMQRTVRGLNVHEFTKTMEDPP